MSAREAWAIKDASGEIIAVHIGDREQSHISDELLERRGMHVVPVRILAPGEMDMETLEDAAKVADSATVRVKTHTGADMSVVVAHRDDIAAAIRALGGEHG